MTTLINNSVCSFHVVYLGLTESPHAKWLNTCWKLTCMPVFMLGGLQTQCAHREDTMQLCIMTHTMCLNQGWRNISGQNNPRLQTFVLLSLLLFFWQMSEWVRALYEYTTKQWGGGMWQTSLPFSLLGSSGLLRQSSSGILSSTGPIQWPNNSHLLP